MQSRGDTVEHIRGSEIGGFRAEMGSRGRSSWGRACWYEGGGTTVFRAVRVGGRDVGPEACLGQY